MEKFFKFIDRVNALAFFTGVVLATGLLLWAVGNSLWEGKAKTSVVVPNASSEKSEVLSLTAWEFIPETGVQVLKLQSTGGESSDYAAEGRNYKTRNLLFVRSDGGNSTWLFPDQSQLISRVERLTDKDSRTKAIYFESQVTSEKRSPNFSLFLAKPNGSSRVELLKDVEKIISSKLFDNSLWVIYQKKLEIRRVEFSLASYELVSDELVAKMSSI